VSQKTLHIIRNAYAANLEEQDDPVLWLVQSMQGAGADGSVLLTGTAVAYGLVAQDAGGLAFGARAQTQPPRIADDLTRMLRGGIEVHYVSEDAADRGVDAAALVPGLAALERAKLADFLSRFDRVFAW
jgi:hypothetical protein